MLPKMITTLLASLSIAGHSSGRYGCVKNISEVMNESNCVISYYSRSRGYYVTKHTEVKDFHEVYMTLKSKARQTSKDAHAIYKGMEGEVKIHVYPPGVTVHIAGTNDDLLQGGVL